MNNTSTLVFSDTNSKLCRRNCSKCGRFHYQYSLSFITQCFACVVKQQMHVYTTVGIVGVHYAGVNQSYTT